MMSDSIRVLPVLKGWTVDDRLREFRRQDGEGMIALSFAAEDGAALAEYVLSKDA